MDFSTNNSIKIFLILSVTFVELYLIIYGFCSLLVYFMNTGVGYILFVVTIYIFIALFYALQQKFVC